MAAEDRDFNTETLNLYRINGVAGLLLQKGKNILANHMPFSDQRAEQLGDLIRKMMAGYETVQRNMRQVLLSYDSGTLLVINQAETQLVLLLTARVELDVISNAAGVFMKEHADSFLTLSPEKSTRPVEMRDPGAPREIVVTGSKAATNGAKLMAEPVKPEISRWPEILRTLEGVLGKVISRAQVKTLVERQCGKASISDPFQLPQKKARELAFQVMEQIPNRNKRATLVAELENSLKELNL